MTVMERKREEGVQLKMASPVRLSEENSSKMKEPKGLC
jgi:hypothetical protein